MNGIRDLTALAEDDAAVEKEIEREGGNALRLALHAYAFHADGGLLPDDWSEEAANRAALLRCLPVVVVSVVVLLLVWGA